MDLSIGFRCLVRRLPLASFLVCQLAAAATDTGTLTEGGGNLGMCALTPPIAVILGIGYDNTLFGSYSPTALSGGKTLNYVMDVLDVCNGAKTATVGVSGFTSNPGISWLTSIACNGVTHSGTSGTFSYFPGSPGTGVWTWGTGQFGFSAGSYTCKIIHS
jgi:hypothetical protein